jgi:hypothetical protein
VAEDKKEPSSPLTSSAGLDALDALESLSIAIGSQLAAHKFRGHWRRRMPSLGCAAFWRLCTWNVNRAVALLKRPEGPFHVGDHCQKMKWRLLWLTRFIPLLYEVGLQMVLCGNGLEALLGDPQSLQEDVDGYSNQFVVLQSIFVVDTQTKRYASARTWGQLVSGKYQDAIVAGIEQVGYSLMRS